jgi:hypothetical protein
MTMMVSILHFWKRARLDLAARLICACLAGGGANLAFAAGPDAAPAEVTQLLVDRSAEGVFVTATVQFELPPAVEDALLKGIPMVFLMEVDIFRNRWYWYDRKVVSAERHMRLAYQPLTRRWRLNVASGQITPNSLGLALNQSFDSLPEALAALRRVSRWKVAEPGEIDPDQKHGIEFRFRLDVSQLPRPFQIGALGQSDWSVLVTATQRLAFEPPK